MTTEPVPPGIVIGVDLGTLTCRLAAMEPTDKFPKVVRNNLSNESSPVVISFQSKGKQRLLGEEALGRECTRPALTCSALKDVLCGRPLLTGCPITESGTMGVPEVGDFSAAQLLAMYLRKCLTWPRGTQTGIAVAVAPSFTKVQRAAVVDACRIAGFSAESVTIVDDIDASAVFLHRSRFVPEGLYNAPQIIVCIGASSSSAVCVVGRKESTVEILMKSEAAKGSSSIDDELLKVVAAHIQTKNKINVLERPKAYNRLIKEIRKCKEVLSSVDYTMLQVDLADDVDLSMKITREMLETAAGPFLDVIRTVLSKIPFDASRKVEMIGNGWRAPCVQRLVRDYFGVDQLCFGLDAASTVAQGTAFAAVRSVEVIGGAPVDLTAWPILDDAAVDALREVEAKLYEVDAADQATEAAKNKLESFLISSVELADRCGGLPKAKERLAREETWLFEGEDDRGAAVFMQRLETLQAELYEICPEMPAMLAKDAEVAAKKEAELAALAEQARREKQEDIPKTDIQRIRLAQERREQGVGLFKQDHFQEAMRRFVQALEVLGNIYDLNDPETKEKRNTISLSCYLNLASCNLKLEQWRPMQSNASKAIEIDPKSAKGYFRRGQANLQIGEYQAARADLNKGMELSGNDPSIAAELQRLDATEANQKAQEKKMFSKMFA